MVDLADIRALINRRKSKILLYAESSLAPGPYLAFRKLLLDELGNSGLEKDLQGLYRMDRQNSRNGMGRPIQQRKEDENE